MTDNTQPQGPAPSQSPVPGPIPDESKKGFYDNVKQSFRDGTFWKKWWFWVAVVVVIFVLAGIAGGSESTKSSASNSTPEVSTETSQTETEKPEEVTPPEIVSITATYTGSTETGTTIDDANTGVVITARYDDDTTETVDSGWKITNPGQLVMGQETTFTVDYNGMQATFTAAGDPPIEYQSALNKAESYSSMMQMSKAGIYDQLVSEYGEQFSPEAAQYAIDHLQADWNANALAKAKTYQESMSMSPAAIRDQLVSEYGEKFTPAEADYAMQHLND